MTTTVFLQQFGPLIVIFIIFYLIVIRPQQKKDKERRNMLNSLKEGDQVITVGGIYGNILDIKDDVITLDVGDKIKIKITLSAVGSVIKKNEEEETK